MTNQQIVLTQEEGSPQHLPKFSLGSLVVWAYVSAHDYGVVVARIWTTQDLRRHTIYSGRGAKAP